MFLCVSSLEWVVDVLLKSWVDDTAASWFSPWFQRHLVFICKFSEEKLDIILIFLPQCAQLLSHVCVPTDYSLPGSFVHGIL